MTRASIDAAAARRAALDASGLGPALPAGQAAVLATIRRLGSVQIDSISVVERAHHHALRSRVADYDPAFLPALETAPRRVLEYWSHAAAYIPVEDWRYCIPRMERIRERGHEWFRADPGTVARVRDRIAAEGPLRVQDFAAPGKGPRGWWDWKPAKIALEYLFHAGELVVTTRRGFQKVYDLPGRALPADLDSRRPDEAEMGAYYVELAARALGVFSRRDLAYLRRDGTEGIEAALAARIEAGALVEFTMEGEAGGSTCLARPELLESACREPARSPSRALVLSPFDPLVIDRRRAKRLFGLDYSIECYLPAAKRSFGYFALPVLYRDGRGNVSFPALVDARALRKEGILEILRLRLETPPREAGRRLDACRASFAGALAAALRRFARDNGAEELRIGRVDCGEPRLEAAFRAALAAPRGRGRPASAGKRP